MSAHVSVFFIFLNVGKFFTQFHSVRWLCKLFEKTLDSVHAGDDLAMY
jgi:hypothetical protein